MSEKLQAILVHALGLSVVAGAFWLNATVLKGTTEGGILIAAAAQLWGQLGFPALPAIQRLTSRPPARHSKPDHTPSKAPE